MGSLQNRYSHSLTTLVRADNPEEADGRISVFRGHDWTFTAVRVVTLEERGLLQKIFKPEELQLVFGAAEMRRAFKKKNEPAFWQAFEKVRPWWPILGEMEFHPIGKSWAGPRELLAQLMSYLLQKARLILWQPEPHLLRPALYCPDMRTAAFVNIAMGSLRVCANERCGRFFEPKRDNLEYHNSKCGVACRTARSRRKKAREEATRQAKRNAKKKARK